MHRIICLGAIGVAIVAGGTSAHADQEQRAIALGDAAKCSQTWNTAEILPDNNNAYGWHPSTPPDKPCLFDGGVQFSYNRPTDSGPRAGSSRSHPEVFQALPSGHANTHVLVMPEGYVGSTESGFSSASLIQTQGRWAYRWYVYYSPGYSSYSFPDGPCTNSSKFATIQPSYLQMSHLNDIQTPLVYGWAKPPDPLAWLPDVSECCNAGPGYDPAAAQDGAIPGSWWRYEIIGHGMDGTPGAYIQVFRKNVTSNGPDRRIVNTKLECPDCGDNGFDWPEQARSALQSPSGMNMLTSNFYRAGTCSGYIATAYALAAQWDEDAGQRIGPAVEMEGSESPEAPAPPTNLKVF